jgi:hypothetical protein
MRSRRDEDLTPVMARELEAVDQALAGAPVGADLAELRDLTLAIRAARPAPEAEFVAELEAWMAGRERPARGAPRARVSRRALLPALGALASLALVAVLALAPGSREHGSRAPALAARTATTETSSPATSPKAQAGPPAAETAAPAPAPGPAPARARGPRRVERSVSLSLAARPERIGDVADGVVRVTDGVGGHVQTSSVASDDRGGGGATFELRIPSPRLDDALAQLSALAHVRSRSQGAEDVTSAYDGTSGRLAEARAERASLLRRLARAATPGEALAVRTRLRVVARRMALLEGRLHALRSRTAFSVVSVAIVPDRHAATGGGSWTPRDALRDAVRILAVALGVALVALAVAVPFLLVGLPAWGAARASRRRRREHALDAI